MKNRSIVRAVGQTYNIHEFLSDSFKINWIFIINDQLLTQNEYKSIKTIYNKSLPIMRTSVMSFDPLGNSLQLFRTKFQKIKGQGRMIKVVCDLQNALLILRNIQEKDRDMISQFYVYAPMKGYNPQRLKIKQEFPQIILKDTIDDVINKASQEINKWRLKFQILKNLMPLDKFSRQKAYQYRIRLNACVRLNPDLFDRYLLLFEDYISQEIESRSLWDQKYQTRACKKRSQIIEDLRKAAQKLKIIDIDYKKVKQMEKKIKQIVQERSKDIININEKDKKQEVIKQRRQRDQLQKQIEEELKGLKNIMREKQKQFTQIMLRLYKKETIFYELINNGIKSFSKKQFKWEHLSLPICLMFKAIKFAYKDQSSIDSQFFEQFVLWRGGKISEKQQVEIITNWQQFPYYEFLSFVSTSKDINVALGFIKNTERQVKKKNCLFKFIMKKPKSAIHKMYSQFFHHGYCSVPNKYGNNNEHEILLNIFSVGKIIDLQFMSFKKLRQQYKIRKNLIDQKQEHEKIPIITVQIGTFEQLFEDENSNIKRERQKQKYRQIIQSFKYTIDIIKKYEHFDFANAYQLCNQMERSYNYLMEQIQKLITINLDDQNAKLQLLYSQESYYSRLSDICRKMGRLSQALLYNDSAIQKCKQLQNIDKNRSFHYYQQKLNSFYMKSSQILIEKHEYSDASKIINQRIQQLKDHKDQKERQRNKVIISRLLLDLGVANFKQGKIDEAKEIFTKSADKIEEIFQFINYDFLNQEKYFFDWIKGVLFDKDVSLFEGPEVFYQRQRVKKIKKETEIYGGIERLHTIKKNANNLIIQTSQAIQNHREYFTSNEEYEKIINEIRSKIDKNTQNQQKTPEEHFMEKNQQKITNSQKLQLARKVAVKKIENEYDKMKKEMNDKLIFEEKDDIKTIQQQQQTILEQKKKIQQLRKKLWQNPDVYLEDSFDFNQEFDQLWLKRQQINRQKLLKNNDKITMDELTIYYKKNAESLNTFILQQQRLGYSHSAPKVLQQYNRLIKLYIEMNCKGDAQKKIQEVKRLANIKGQEKYKQLAEAYFLKGKIYQEAAEIDFLTLMQQGSKQRLKYIQEIRRKNIGLALIQFGEAELNFRKALVKIQNGKENLSIFLAQPQQLELKTWKVKNLLTSCDLTEQKQDKTSLLQKANSLLGEISNGLQYIHNSRLVQLKADYLQALATYQFRKKQYKSSFKSFKQCIDTREKKFGSINWQNTLTIIKIINLFYMADNARVQLTNYTQSLQKNHFRYKNYPFQWKISLAKYFLNKDCEPHKAKPTIQLLQYTLIAMEKIGFAQQHFYLQYQLIYQFQYKEFFNKNQAYLIHRPRIQKKIRKVQSLFIIRQSKENSKKEQFSDSKLKRTISIKQQKQQSKIEKEIENEEQLFQSFAQTDLMNSVIPSTKLPIRKMQYKISLNSKKNISKNNQELPFLKDKKRQSFIKLEMSQINNYIGNNLESSISKYPSTFYSKNSKITSNDGRSTIRNNVFSRRSGMSKRSTSQFSAMNSSLLGMFSNEIKKESSFIKSGKYYKK